MSKKNDVVGFEVGEHDRGGRGDSISNDIRSRPAKRFASDRTIADVKAGNINRAKK